MSSAEPAYLDADAQAQLFRDFNAAGEALAAEFEGLGQRVKAAALRGALVILGNGLIEEGRLAEPGYQAALVALHGIVDSRLPGDPAYR